MARRPDLTEQRNEGRVLPAQDLEHSPALAEEVFVAQSALRP